MPRNEGDNQERLLQHTVLLLESIRAHPGYLADLKKLSGVAPKKPELTRDEFIRRWPVLAVPLQPRQPLLVVSPERWTNVWQTRLEAHGIENPSKLSDLDAFSYNPRYGELLQRAVLGLKDGEPLQDSGTPLFFSNLTSPRSPLHYLWLKPVHFIAQQALALFDPAEQRRKMLAADFLVPVYPWTTAADLTAAVQLGRAHVDSSPTVNLLPQPGKKQPRRITVQGPPTPPADVMRRSQLRPSSVKPPLKHTRTIDSEEFEQQAVIYHLRRLGHTPTHAGRLVYGEPRSRKGSGNRAYQRAHNASNAFWKKVRSMYDYALTWNWMAARERGWQWVAPTIRLPRKPPWTRKG